MRNVRGTTILLVWRTNSMRTHDRVPYASPLCHVVSDAVVRQHEKNVVPRNFPLARRADHARSRPIRVITPREISGVTSEHHSVCYGSDALSSQVGHRQRRFNGGTASGKEVRRSADWIELLRNPTSGTTFCRQGRCIQCGVFQSQRSQIEIIGNLDADISFDQRLPGIPPSKVLGESQLGVGGTPSGG